QELNIHLMIGYFALISDKLIHHLVKPFSIQLISYVLQNVLLVWRILETIVDKFMIRFGVNVSLDYGFPLNYTTSVTKTKAADYGHIKWIEDLVPRTMWIQEPIGYDKHALWGVSHWGRKRQQFYGFTVNWESARDVIVIQRCVKDLQLGVESHQKKLNLTNPDTYGSDLKRKEAYIAHFNPRGFIYQNKDKQNSIVIQRRVKDLQLGVESHQKKLNLTNPDTYRSDLKRKEAYIAHFNPRGFIYQNKDKQNRLMRIYELHKFGDGTLTDVRTALDDRLKGIQM
nr:hypothetical protein [Tanacetum cinerariifolium]